MSRPISSEHPLIVYGAGGVTGRLIVAEAARRGVPMLLAGRGRASFSDLADRYGLPTEAVAIEDAAAMARLARRGAVLLNTAGPFILTAPALAKAAIAGGAAYADVSGEVDSLIALRALDGPARTAQVPLLAAAGYGVASGECMALHVARRLERPVRLRLGLDTFVGQRSPGAAQSTIAALRRGGYEIRDGVMRRTGFADRPWRVETGGESHLFVGAPLAEAWAAWSSTGVQEVRAGIRTRPLAIPVLRVLALAARIGPVGDLIARRASAPAKAVDGPPRQGRSTVIAEAWDDSGQRVASMLTTEREGYAAAAGIAVAAAQAITQTGLGGFLTPAAAFGPDFILGVEGFTRRDLS